MIFEVGEKEEQEEEVEQNQDETQVESSFKGVSIEEVDAKLKEDPQNSTTQQKFEPPLVVRISAISPTGVLKITFSEAMKNVPADPRTFDYSKIFSFSVVSFSDDDDEPTEYEGDFVNSQRRILK